MNSLLEVLILNSKFLLNFELLNKIVSFGHQNSVELSSRVTLVFKIPCSLLDL